MNLQDEAVRGALMGRRVPTNWIGPIIPLGAFGPTDKEAEMESAMNEEMKSAMNEAMASQAPQPERGEVSQASDELSQALTMLEATAAQILSRLEDAGVLRPNEPVSEVPADAKPPYAAPYASMVALQAMRVAQVDASLRAALRKLEL